MANKNIVFMYCLKHERECEVRPYRGKEVHLTDDSFFCVGPFAECPPPPALTEEEWDTILEKEYYRYAS